LDVGLGRWLLLGLLEWVGVGRKAGVREPGADAVEAGCIRTARKKRRMMGSKSSPCLSKAAMMIEWICVKVWLCGASQSVAAARGVCLFGK
jgi:hypothetical protein